MSLRDRFLMARQSHDRVESIVHRWSTHDTYSLDGVPYMGKFLPASKQLYALTGFNRMSMALGAIDGRLVSELITKGTHLFAHLYHLGRFKPVASAGQ